MHRQEFGNGELSLFYLALSFFLLVLFIFVSFTSVFRFRSSNTTIAIRDPDAYCPQRADSANQRIPYQSTQLYSSSLAEDLKICHQDYLLLVLFRLDTVPNDLNISQNNLLAYITTPIPINVWVFELHWCSRRYSIYLTHSSSLLSSFSNLWILFPSLNQRKNILFQTVMSFLPRV